MNYRNPACDSPTPWDGKRHLEGNLEGIFWQKCCQAAEIQLSGAGHKLQELEALGSCFLDLGLTSITQRLFELDCSCSGKHFEDVETLEFSCCLGSLLRGKTGDRFLTLHALLSSWSPPSPAYPASTSWEFLGNPAVISGVPIPGKSAVNGNTALFVWELPSVLPCILQAELSMENEV